jgi:hypothetical protein
MSIDYYLHENGWSRLTDGFHRYDMDSEKPRCGYDSGRKTRIRVWGEFIVCTECLRADPIQVKLMQEIGRISTGKVREYLFSDPDFQEFITDPSRPNGTDSKSVKEAKSAKNTKLTANQKKIASEREKQRLELIKMAKQAKRQRQIEAQRSKTAMQTRSVGDRYAQHSISLAHLEVLKTSSAASWMQLAAGRLFQDGQTVRTDHSTSSFEQLCQQLPAHEFTDHTSFWDLARNLEMHEWPTTVIEVISQHSSKSKFADFEYEVKRVANLRDALIKSDRPVRDLDNEKTARGFKQFEWMTAPEEWRTD